jgi:hypothetical protein
MAEDDEVADQRTDARRIDRRGRLAASPFAFRASKGGKVFISWHGRQVTILSGTAARKFIAGISDADDQQAQFLMARATGHFKHGNER